MAAKRRTISSDRHRAMEIAKLSAWELIPGLVSVDGDFGGDERTDFVDAKILRRSDDMVVGLVARRDLLRVRSAAVRHEREREALIRLGKWGTGQAN